MTMINGAGQKYITKYTHDSRGNIIRSYETTGNHYKQSFKLKYKNGRLVSRKGGYTTKYYYKKIRVSKKNVAKIKKQQWLFINGFL